MNEFVHLSNLILKSKQPTEAQKEAGNYKKDHVKIHGFNIAIENKKGSIRSGMDADGNKWSNKITLDYGYIKGTTGNDGDHIDVFIGPDPESEIVYIINQSKKGKDSFDEHKVMVGFSVMDDAVDGYLSNYDDGWEENILSIEPMTIDQFRQWINKSNHNKPAQAPEVIKAVS